ASHVMGLIAGGSFQPDAMKYSDIVYGSTHKTFFGPQGGIILTTDSELFNEIENNTIFRTMDNINLSRIASLSIAVEEMLKYGNEYASAVVKNTAKLIAELHNQDFKIAPGSEHSKSHQILLDQEFLGRKNYNFHSFSEELERHGVIIDRFGRIGTQEITRNSINDMHKIASILSGLYNKLNRADEIKEIIDKKSLKYW
ncbi:MAG: serine hydroxymethyltransferase, partial [Ferroplasma sp.]